MTAVCPQRDVITATFSCTHTLGFYLTGPFISPELLQIRWFQVRPVPKSKLLGRTFTGRMPFLPSQQHQSTERWRCSWLGTACCQLPPCCYDGSGTLTLAAAAELLPLCALLCMREVWMARGFEWTWRSLDLRTMYELPHSPQQGLSEVHGRVTPALVWMESSLFKCRQRS